MTLNTILLQGDKLYLKAMNTAICVQALSANMFMFFFYVYKMRTHFRGQTQLFDGRQF